MTCRRLEDRHPMPTFMGLAVIAIMAPELRNSTLIIHYTARAAR
jgi:hypothetical protein